MRVGVLVGVTVGVGVEVPVGEGVEVGVREVGTSRGREHDCTASNNTNKTRSIFFM